MNDILQSLQWRYATKQFDPTKKVSDQDFQTLLDALVLTPSSYGIQPWKFVVVKNPEVRQKLQPVSWNQPQIVDASHLIVFTIPLTIDEAYIEKYLATISDKRGITTSQKSGEDVSEAVKHLEMYKSMMISGVIQGMTDEQRKTWAQKQVYIALGNLMTVASTMKIDTCPIEGFSPEKYDEILGLPQHGLASVVVCPVGYRSESDKYAKMEKVRFDASEVILEI